jgi:Leucine-rich repeat (LRR) protein
MIMSKTLLLIVSALIVLTIVDAVQAQSIFPDKNLENAVRREVFEKKFNDMPLTEEDVVNISTIVGKNKGIKSLAGLEKCRSLADLNVEGNEIEDVSPIKDLKILQTLTLAKNKIKDVKPLEGLIKLQYLELSNNQITDLAPLAKLENMRSLYLERNQIKDLGPVAGMPKLWSLYLEGNQVDNLAPISGLKSLEILDVRGNAVSDLSPLQGLNRWTYLFLDNNKVTDLGVLIAMAKADKEGAQRFAPFWNVYLSGNPLSDDAKKTQLETLKKYAKMVTFEAK